MPPSRDPHDPPDLRDLLAALRLAIRHGNLAEATRIIDTADVTLMAQRAGLGIPLERLVASGHATPPRHGVEVLLAPVPTGAPLSATLEADREDRV